MLADFAGMRGDRRSFDFTRRRFASQTIPNEEELVRNVVDKDVAHEFVTTETSHSLRAVRSTA